MIIRCKYIFTTKISRSTILHKQMGKEITLVIPVADWISLSHAHIPPQSWQFVLLFSLSYYRHTSATVNHLQAPPPCNTPLTQIPLNQTPQTTNCYPTQDVFPSLLFLYLYVHVCPKPDSPSLRQCSNL